MEETQIDAVKERRFKIVKVWQDHALMMYSGGFTGDDPTYYTSDIPKGSKVVAVYYNFSCQCFDFLVAHESFPPTEPGYEVESLQVKITAHRMPESATC